MVWYTCKTGLWLGSRKCLYYSSSGAVAVRASPYPLGFLFICKKPLKFHPLSRNILLVDTACRAYRNVTLALISQLLSVISQVRIWVFRTDGLESSNFQFLICFFGTMSSVCLFLIVLTYFLMQVKHQTSLWSLYFLNFLIWWIIPLPILQKLNMWVFPSLSLSLYIYAVFRTSSAIVFFELHFWFFLFTLYVWNVSRLPPVWLGMEFTLGICCMILDHSLFMFLCPIGFG